MLGSAPTKLPMRKTDDPLASRRLYIVHLATSLERMEAGLQPMHPVAYRLFARRLKAAAAGYPEARLAADLGHDHPAVAELLDLRHFDVHGSLPGAAAARACRDAQLLLQRMTTVA